ncbi:MAG TPA: nitrilase-related carbon-nitrogen hydrolase [Ktedonobacterales bacterium]|jgi:predicted amidohydrolase
MTEQIQTDQTGQGAVVRAVAVGNKLNVAAAASEASYVAELERILTLAEPHLMLDRPNLVVLTEVLGLPAALVGNRGALARRPPGRISALALLGLAAVTPRFRRIDLRWVGAGLAAAGLANAALTAYLRKSQLALGLLAVGQGDRVARCLRMWRGISPTRALLLASCDALYRPLVETLSRLAVKYSATIVAGTLAPEVRRSTDAREIRRWGRAGADCVYIPTGPEVYNTALVFGPDGSLLGRVNKVFLTASDREQLDVTPGKLEDVQVIPTPAGRLGVAISLDAFTPQYVRHLDAAGAEIVVQPDANDTRWAGLTRETRRWQPEDWLVSVLGSIQPKYRNLRYNVCAMQTGNLYEIPFDGQSSITAQRDAALPKPAPNRTFIGVDEHVNPDTGEALLGEFLAVAPWVMEDPVVDNPLLSLEERRKLLAERSVDLLPKGRKANQYRETAIWADLYAHSAQRP